MNARESENYLPIFFKDILGLKDIYIYIWLKEGVIILEITLQFTFLVSRTKTNAHKCIFFYYIYIYISFRPKISLKKIGR
jgi:hypothetical protein